MLWLRGLSGKSPEVHRAMKSSNNGNSSGNPFVWLGLAATVGLLFWGAFATHSGGGITDIKRRLGHGKKSNHTATNASAANSQPSSITSTPTFSSGKPSVKPFELTTTTPIGSIYPKNSPEYRVFEAFAYGDAAGAPIENLTAARIAKLATDRKNLGIGHPQYVASLDAFLDQFLNFTASEYNYTGFKDKSGKDVIYSKAETTDDSCMFKITATALDKYKDLDLNNDEIRARFHWDCLNLLANEIEKGENGAKGKKGFGDTTIQVAARARQHIKDNPSNYWTTKPDAFASTKMNADGNGPMTRGLPLALAFYKDDAFLRRITNESVGLTHYPGPNATPRHNGGLYTYPEATQKATLAYNLIVAKILNLSQAQKLELADKTKRQGIIKKIYTDIANDRDIKGTEIAELIQNIKPGDYTNSIVAKHIFTGDKANETSGVSGKSWDGLRLSLWAFLEHETMGEALKDVLKKGGDTDSNGALTNALFEISGNQTIPRGQLKQGTAYI